MGKRAGITFSTLIFAFYRMMILFMVALALVLFVRQFVKASIDISDVESELFAQGLMKSPDGLSYVDPVTGRVYPGVIDYDTFTDIPKLEEKLNNVFYYEKNMFIAADVELLSQDGKQFKSAAPAYYNKDMYQVWYPLAKTGFIGAGGAELYKKIYPVLIREQSGYTEGLVRITIVMPRS